MKQLLPFCNKQLSIGLLGGTFDPPHKGHLAISEDAMKRFGFDYVWWVVALQNTLKPKSRRSFEERVQLCKDFLKGKPNFLVSEIENEIKCENTIDLINFLQANCQNEYVWLMGSDIPIQIHQWPHWKELIHKIKIVVYDRPKFLLKDIEAQISPEFYKYKCSLGEFKEKPAPPAWTSVHEVLVDISSTEIRRNQA